MKKKKEKIKLSRSRKKELYRKVISFALPYKFMFLFGMLLNLIFSTLTTLSVALIQPLFKIIFNSESNNLSSIESSPAGNSTFFSRVTDGLQHLVLDLVNSDGSMQSILLNMSILIVSVFVLKNFFKYIATAVTASVHEGIVKDIRDTVFSKVTSLSISYFNRNKQGNLISIISNDITVINQNLIGSISSVLRDGMQVILFLFLLLGISAELTLIAFSTSILSFVIIRYLTKYLRRYASRMQSSMGEYTSTLAESIAGIRIIKAFNAEKDVNEKFNSDSQRYKSAAVKHKKILAIIPSINEVMAITALCVVLFVGSSKIASNLMQPEDLTAFLFALFAIMSPITSLLNVISKYTRGLIAAERVMTIIEQKPQLISGKRPIKDFDKSIDADSVSFAYNDDYVLKDVSFKLEKGKKIAFVGSSGSGKSTMADLLIRFYDPVNGELLIDEIDIRELDINDYRNLFGIVSQETILFNDTLLNNIRYGDKNIAEDDVIKAAENANAMSFVKKLPEGLNTVIGDRGVLLSGGERQRIAIARALVRDPKILIFDEATSSLDAESEKIVQQAINRSLENKTAVIVAHRLSTIIDCDEILVFDRGNIVERGSHKELLEKKGIYCNLYKIQLGGKDV